MKKFSGKRKNCFILTQNRTSRQTAARSDRRRWPRVNCPGRNARKSYPEIHRRIHAVRKYDQNLLNHENIGQRRKRPGWRCGHLWKKNKTTTGHIRRRYRSTGRIMNDLSNIIVWSFRSIETSKRIFPKFSILKNQFQISSSTHLGNCAILDYAIRCAAKIYIMSVTQFTR